MAAQSAEALSGGRDTMTTRERIQCINKSDRQNAHERILNVGGVNDSGSRWKLSETDAIDGIERGDWDFYVHVGRNTVHVIIAKSAAGTNTSRQWRTGYSLTIFSRFPNAHSHRERRGEAVQLARPFKRLC